MTTLDLWPIGNCQVSALVDREGRFVWGCVPRVDGDPTFCALLRGPEGQDAGTWRFELENQTSVTQRYSRNTPILVTRLEDDKGGAVEVIDFGMCRSSSSMRRGRRETRSRRSSPCAMPLVAVLEQRSPTGCGC